MKARWDITALLVVGGIVFGYGLARVQNKNARSIELVSKTNSFIPTPGESALTAGSDKKVNNVQNNPTTDSKLTSQTPFLSSTQSEKNTPVAIPTEKEAKKQLQHLLQNSVIEKLTTPGWQKGIVKEQTPQGDKTQTKETLADGTEAYRWYRKDGSLDGESLLIAGESTNSTRSFFQSGKIKEIHHTFNDSTTLFIQMDSSGFMSQRVFQKPDGSYYLTQFDDQGNPVQNVWVAQANGPSVIF